MKAEILFFDLSTFAQATDLTAMTGYL